jgi:hypothetical protein
MGVATGVLATVAAWITVAHFTPVEAAPPVDTKPAADAKDTKPVDLSALRDAVDAAARKGENVDDIRKALDALEKTMPKNAAGRVPPELQALRDTVDAAARKGENVEAITKELLAVEMAVAGKSLAKPRPEPRPQPQPQPQPGFPGFPAVPQPVPFPEFPAFPNPGIGGGVGGIDVEVFNKAMDLQRRAMEMMMKNPRDPDTIKEAQKLRTEASELLLKAARNGGGGIGGAGIGMPVMPLFPDAGRFPDRARLGIRMERVPAVAVEQLGLEPNTGIAVTMIVANSPAEKAGLKVHDIILEFAGKPVTDNAEDLARRVNEVKAGEKVDLVVLRKGKKVEVKGVELPEPAKRPAFPNAFPQPFPVPPVPGGLPNKPLPLPGVLPDVGPKPVPVPNLAFPQPLPVNPQPLPVNPPPLPIPVPQVLPVNPQPLPLNPAPLAPPVPNG